MTTQLKNLDAERAESVLDKISNLFDSVKSQVFELMDKDSFERFRMTDKYKNLRARMVTSGWIDTSGGETLDQFDLPAGLITVRDVDEERKRTLARKQEMATINPEAVKQQKKDQYASHMLAVASNMSRKHILDMSRQTHLRSPVDASNVVYPFTVEVDMQLTTLAATGALDPNQRPPPLRVAVESDYNDRNPSGHRGNLVQGGGRGPSPTSSTASSPSPSPTNNQSFSHYPQQSNRQHSGQHQPQPSPTVRIHGARAHDSFNPNHSHIEMSSSLPHPLPPSRSASRQSYYESGTPTPRRVQVSMLPSPSP